MQPTCQAPLATPSTPTFALPPGSCDSHCHIYGPHERFPYARDRAFTPPDSPQARLRARHDLLGVERAVLVQSAAHGFDHAAMLDALSASPRRYRGVALLRPDTPAREVARLDELGVCGVRLHLVSHLGVPPDAEQVRAIVALAAPFGWHVECHTMGADLVANEQLLASLPGQIVIDHLGRVDLREGLDGPAVLAMLRLLARGNVWVKLSGLERMSLLGAPYPDAVELARLVARAAPRRVVWGTDFPHPNIVGDMVDEGLLVDLLPRIVPDPAARADLLVHNPAHLFGF